MRLLNAREIECRVQKVNQNGVSLLLYKDARCDMAILDETFGSERWQRKHELIDGNLYCSVGIKYGEEWVWKQDVGTESNTEKEKGQASDSFKRACFNVGIGRELYTAPFIWIPADRCEIASNNGKYICNTRFDVSSVEYNEFREIASLSIVNAKTGAAVYTYGKNQDVKQSPVSSVHICEKCGKQITENSTADSKVFSVEQIISISKKRHGKTYCCECMAELKNRKKVEE